MTFSKIKSMRACIYIFLCILICRLNATAQTSDTPLTHMNSEQLLEVLDWTLQNKDIFEEKKAEKIALLKSELASATDVEQLYWTSRNLYNEYKTYDSDSALHYVNASLEYAIKANRAKWINEMYICRSYVYSATGLLEEAQKSIDLVDQDNLDRSLSLECNEQLLFLYTHRDQYRGTNSKDNPYTSESLSLLNNQIMDLPQSDPQYCWFKGWYSLSDTEESKKTIPIILSIVNNSSFQTVNDAKNAWILSRLYEKIGDEPNKLRFLILSAIADARSCNKEISSLEEIAGYLYNRNELKRANEYINYSLNCANAYKSRVRVGKLADLQYKIASVYQQQAEKRNQDLRTYSIALVTIVILLLLSLVFTFVQNRKLRVNKAALDSANSQLNQQISEQENLQQQLKSANEQLLDANEKLKEMYSSAKQDTVELSETNYAKERLIADIFSICSNYINKLDDFRRNIHAMLLAHRYADLKELTKTPELSYAETKELYQIFDKIFLGIYPDFVKDFNKLLRPEEQIALKKDEQLNTELRIYALVRLGLNDSTKIAQFLHCSVRTVYNTRQRIRNKAIIPKDEFANTVKSLGKIAY